MSNPGCTSSNFKPKRSDFSIARILGTFDQSSDSSDSPPASPEECVNFTEDNDQHNEQQRFEWLQCTRYRPPRLPRSRRREGAQRRKLGRNPRIPFSSSQVAILEQRFRRSQYLSSADVAELAAFLSLSETRVKIWFQNRRARERRDRDAKQRSALSPAESGESTSAIANIARVHGLSFTLNEIKTRGLSETAAALTGIARMHGLINNDLTISQANPLMKGSAFAPVNPLALVALTSQRTNITYTSSTIRPDSPDD